MKLKFRDIPKGLPCKVRGYDAKKTGNNSAKAKLFGMKKADSIFVLGTEVCEIEDWLADANQLGQFGIPPRPWVPPPVTTLGSNMNRGEVAERKRREGMCLLGKALTTLKEGGELPPSYEGVKDIDLPIDNMNSEGEDDGT